MRKQIYIILLPILLIANSTVFGQVSIDSLKIDRDSFNVTLEQGDSIFNYIPSAWDLDPIPKDSKLNKNTPVRSAKSIAIQDETMNLSHIPTSFTIDKTKDVGEIAIKESSNNGSLSYTIPIELYSSANGVSPSVQLAYNSLGGNGSAGFGWQIGGFSAIASTNKTIYYDGNVSGIQSNGSSSNAWTLDGKRLINLNTGTATQINYQTESGLIKVSAFLSGTIVKYFVASFTDGTVATFGFETNTTGKVSYPLTKTEDSRGNTITYSYTERNNIYYPSEINYGLRKGTNIVNSGKVKFAYETRTDIDVSYSADAEIKQDQRLKEITTYFNGQLLRTYTLSYEYNTVSLLKKVDCASSGKYLNPLMFYYGENNIVSKFEKYSVTLGSYFTNASPSDLVLSKWKFDISSIKDGLISYPAKNTYGLLTTRKNMFGIPIGYRYGSTYASDQVLLTYSGLASGLSIPSQLTAEEGFIQLIPLDVDGDGNEELVKMNSNVIDSGTDRVTFKVYNTVTSLGKSYPNLKYTFTADFGGVVDWGGLNSAPSRTYLAGDFLGNGKQSILFLSYCKNVKEEKISSWATLVDIDGKTKSSIYNKTCFDIDPENSRLYTIDFDGDGKADICYINAKGIQIYTFNAEGQLYEIASYTGYTGISFLELFKRGKEVLMGDINGDGKSDIIVTPGKYTTFLDIKPHIGTCNFACSGEPTSSSADGKILVYVKGGTYCQVYKDPVTKYFDDASTWITLLSTGKGYVRSNQNVVRGEIDKTYILQDMNGDGQADLVVNDDGTIQVHLINSGIIKTQAESGTITLEKPTDLIPGNVMQSGKMSQLFAIKNSTLNAISFTRNESKQRLLTGVINSSGVVAKHGYGSLQNPNGIYANGTIAIYPYRNLMGNLQLYAGSDVYLNNTRIGGNSINYTKGIIHLQGKGFLGFEKITNKDDIRNTTVTQTFDPINFGVLKSMDSPTSSGTYNYNVSFAANKIATVTLTNKIEKDKLKDVTVTSTYTYDTYGNPTKEVADNGAGIKRTTVNVYNNLTATPYILGQLAEQTTTNEVVSTSLTASTKTSVSYNANGQPLTKKKYYGANLSSEEAYVYDTNRNLTESKSKAYTSTTWLIDKYTYDTYARISRKTDPLGFYVDNVYDAKGQLSSIKNHKSQETKYDYNVWGNNIKTTYPDGLIEASSLAWNSALTGTLILSVTTATGQPNTQVYIDALGREIRKGVQRFDGKYLYTDYVYNILGQLEKSSLPFKGTAPTKWNTYTYDAYDRITALTYASGKKDTYVYDKNKVTETKDNVAKTYAFDATGQVITVVDLAGTITYNYRPDGQTSSIVAPGAVTTSFEYDTYGRQTAIIDPSAGKKSFTYDAAGNINQETDARGKVTKTVYDTYNRITSKEVVGESTTTYGYNTDALLSGVSTKNTAGTVIHSKTFTYDVFFKLQSEKETTVDSKSIEKTYAYSAGNVASVAYKSNTSGTGTIATENYSYLYGTLSEIKLNNTTSIWKLTQENDLGIPSEAITGGLIRAYSYDAFGMPTARTIKNGTTVIQNFGYGFNTATGNLTWRKDNNRTIQENFVYDGLNRLTEFAGKKITYDVKGNITDFTTVGKFDYSATKPYAIEYATPYVTPYGTEIPLRNQTVTYNGMMRPESISENNYIATFVYNGSGDRIKMEIQKTTALELTRYYVGDQYEVDAGVAGAKERLYLGGDAYSAAAVYVKEGTGAWTLYYIGRDYLGSITHVINANGTVKQELSYDPWGRLRNPVDQKLYAVGTEPALFLGRGYTGHEHLTMFGLINMNARLYDPVLGRFLSPDPYVQAPDWSQNFNRYSYCLNNPLKFNDPSGESFWSAVASTLTFGLYGLYLHNQAIKAGASSSGAFLFAGVVSGITAAAAYAGAAIAASGIIMANTLAIMGSSLINSSGMYLVNGGQGSISMSLGVASYDFSNGTFGYLGKKGNQWYENFVYGLGALANVSDFLMGFNNNNIKDTDLITEHSDGAGHSSLVKARDVSGSKSNSYISVGPDRVNNPNGSWHWMKGTNKWNSYSDSQPIWRHTLKVNTNKIEGYAKWLNSMEATGTLKYSVELSSCVTHTSMALNYSGIFNIGIHPYILNAQMSLWSAGIRPWSLNSLIK